MSARIHTSSPTERSFQWDRQWQHPGRREHIHGRIRPLVEESGMGGWIGLTVFVAASIVVGFCLYASVGRAPATAQHTAAFDASGGEGGGK